MAESAVKSAANWLGKLLVEEGKYLWGAEDKVIELRNELVWMQCFLREADALQYDDEIVSLWVLQIKEHVSEAEDVADKFVVDITWGRRQPGCLNKLKRWLCIGKELYALHQVASRIDNLQHKISMLTPKLQTYGLKTAYGMKSYRTREALSEQAQQRMSYVHLESKKIVGLQQDTDTIVNALLHTEEKRRVVAIYGMGGLGKTTLATKVYNDDKVKEHFNGGCAWVYISKAFRVENVLRKLISDLTSKPTDMIIGKDNASLIRELREFTQKKNCLVVLDDVWETTVWDCLEAAFHHPDGVESASKVLLTTRKEDIAKHADRDPLPKPAPLNQLESWELLELTMGWADVGNGERDFSERIRAQSIQTGSNGEKDIETLVDGSNENKRVQTKVARSRRQGLEKFENDERELVELGKSMVKHCDGIPLAIVALGGILRKKETVKEWRLVCENITSYLKLGNDHGKSYMDVLVLSYNDLPYHLKPCFLHLGSFPEDYEIQTGKLYRIWVAEGLVTCPHDRVSSTETLEDIANDYLNDLAQAGMVQIMNKRSDGRIKSIRIHDLMRDVCLQKATIENFLSIIDHRRCPDEPQLLTSSSSHARLLRMAIYLAQGVKNYLPEFLTSKAHKYLRSLLLFGGQEVSEGETEQWMTCICKDFRWLRVLDIEGLRVRGRLTSDVKKVKHLRYLSLKETYVSDLPSSLGNLNFLESLDLRVSFAGSLKIPNTLWKLQRLRHLFLPKKPYEIKYSDLLWLDTLSNLETLKNLEAAKFRVEDLRKLKRLKRFSIKDVSELEKIRIITESPAIKSGGLRSCSFGVEGSVIDVKPSILSNINCLHRLNIVGKISRLEENDLPQSLEVLHLVSCALRNDPMRILGSLHHLKDLSLGHNSFVGKEMICEVESFPQLTMLNLQGLANLEDWTLKQKSMSRLKKLIIMDCGKLNRIPDDLPSFVRVTCSPCINGIEKYGTCNYYGTTFSVAEHVEVLIERADEMRGLVKLLLNRRSKKVVLWGAGGVGKTTFARMLYNQPEIRDTFASIAWARWPQKEIHSIAGRLIQGLLRQLDPLSQCANASIGELQKVMEQQKCLVVLTDLKASIEDLDVIFGTRIPDGSKVLLLTIDKPSNNDPNKLDTHNLEPISRDQSLELFKRILEDALSGSEGNEKVELGENMLEHCLGHAQSIVMLAGLLTMKHSLIEWKRVQKEVTLHMEKYQGPQLIYALSYADLPHHLKHCFLYLASFPEDTEISTSKLYRMWIAAGLVRLKDDQDSSKKRKEDEVEVVKLLENVAASYLSELVLRGMIQVAKKGSNKRICKCRLHTALRSLCLDKAREEQFVNCQSKSAYSNESLGRRLTRERCTCWLCFPLQNVSLKTEKEEHVTTISRLERSVSASNERVSAEHWAIHLTQGEKEILHNLTSTPGQIKSLLFFPEASNNKRGESNWLWCRNICNHFTLLWILDLEGMWLTEGTLPPEVGNLSQLKYLSLRGTWVTELPSTIEQLSNLETLDLRVMDYLLIPDVLFNFRHLRHLHLPDSIALKSQKLRLHGLNQLQTLANLHTDKVNLDCVSDLKNLRKISIKNIHTGTELDDKLKFINAEQTHASINSEIVNGNPAILSSFQNLHKVTIKGRIQVPIYGMFPSCLKELKLKHTALEEDPIPILDKLPGLKDLFFDQDSFLGKKMIFSLGFPQLTQLTLRLLSNLEELDMTAADHLQHIEPLITECWRLNVKRTETATAQIQSGPLGDHPVMSVLTQTSFDSWRLNKKDMTYATAQIRPGPLGDHPVLSVVTHTFTDSRTVKKETTVPAAQIQPRPLGDHPVMAVLTQTFADSWRLKQKKMIVPAAQIQPGPLGDHPVVAVLMQQTRAFTDCWPPKVKETTAQPAKIQIGQLGNHPVMEVLISDAQGDGEARVDAAAA